MEKFHLPRLLDERKKLLQKAQSLNNLVKIANIHSCRLFNRLETEKIFRMNEKKPTKFQREYILECNELKYPQDTGVGSLAFSATQRSFNGAS